MLKNIAGLLICMLVLTACGQMGPLYLPPPTPQKNTHTTHLDKMIENS